MFLTRINDWELTAQLVQKYRLFFAFPKHHRNLGRRVSRTINYLVCPKRKFQQCLYGKCAPHILCPFVSFDFLQNKLQ